jgi:hypothetical protein
LQNLSLRQTVALTKADPALCYQLYSQKQISPENYKSAIRLVHLLSMNNIELVQALQAKEIIEYIEEDEKLLPNLVDLLPQDKLEDKSIEITINLLLNKTAVDANDDDKISVSENAQCEDIIIHSSSNEYCVKKSKLMAVSDYFKAAFSEIWSKKEYDLSKTDHIWVDIVVNYANGQVLILSFDNIETILFAAEYFHIKCLIYECDIWLARLKEWPFVGKSFGERWNLCKRFSLNENKKILFEELVNRLNKLSINDKEFFADLEILNDVDRESVRLSFDNNEFMQSLRNPEFLSWIWPHVNPIPFLKEVVVKFCAQDVNKDTILRAWFTMPSDLKEAALALRY